MNEEPTQLQIALGAADAGNAGHWPTVAGILADEYRAIERKLAELKVAVERIGTDASAIQYLSYGPDGDCGAVSIAERIEYECDQILQANAEVCHGANDQST